jgi:hypothetical protein
VICLILLAAGLAGGQAWVPATGASYIDLSAEEISHASPLLSSMMRLGQAFGAAFGAIVLEAELAHRAAGPAARLAYAYHASFQWAAVAALIAVLMFLALARSSSCRAGRGLAEANLGWTRSLFRRGVGARAGQRLRRLLRVSQPNGLPPDRRETKLPTRRSCSTTNRQPVVAASATSSSRPA